MCDWPTPAKTHAAFGVMKSSAACLTELVVQRTDMPPNLKKVFNKVLYWYRYHIKGYVYDIQKVYIEANNYLLKV